MRLLQKRGWRHSSDAELVAAARTDAGPFRELYDRYAGRVLAYHRRRCGEDAAAHELTAETFAQVWLSRERFRDQAGGSAAPWIFGIARNVLLTSVRLGALERKAREELALEPLDLGVEPAEPETAWLDGLDEALADLPAGQREALRLRVVGQASYGEVAEALEITPAAARVRVHRGLGTLRRKLTENRRTRVDNEETER